MNWLRRMNAWMRWWVSLRNKPEKEIPETIYYVAGDGHDDNDGKHPLRAWQSIERLNAERSNIRKNDQILFKRGSQYAGRPFYLEDKMHVTVRIGAYGSGQHPVFPDIKKTKLK
ncbi:MAG: hypothetical protein HKN87_07715 [Saprospiraceae bacterium]|nr:hypothetical protein [Saprospiraceae bacterium]